MVRGSFHEPVGKIHLDSVGVACSSSRRADMRSETHSPPDNPPLFGTGIDDQRVEEIAGETV